MVKSMGIKKKEKDPSTYWIKFRHVDGQRENNKE